MPKKNKISDRHNDVTPIFDTLAIQDDSLKTPVTNISTPPIQAIKEAKAWVDHNEK